MTAFGIAVFKERCGRLRAASLIFALIGTSLIFGAPAHSASALPAEGLALLSAIGSAVYYTAGARAIAPGQSAQGAAALCILGTLAFVPLLVAQPPSVTAVDRAWPYVLMIIVVGTMIPLLLAQAGMSRAGLRKLRC